MGVRCRSLGSAAVREGICWFCQGESHSLLEDMEHARRTIQCLFCVWMIANIVAAFPQSPRKFSSVLVTEVHNLDTETKDPEGKLREKAEAREASERRRPSSNFFSRG